MQNPTPTPWQLRTLMILVRIAGVALLAYCLTQTNHLSC